MYIERHIVGETPIKEMKTETTTRITENNDSTENATTVEK